MAQRDDCIEGIIKASGGKLTRKEAMDALDEILGRAERNGPSWKAQDEKLAAAAIELQDQLIERAAVAARNERMAAMKAIARHRYYDSAPTPAQGLEAKLGGVNTPFAGARLSVDSQYRGLRRSLLGGFWDELTSARTPNLPEGGLEKIFLSRKLEREWATELHQLNTPKGGRPGITGSLDAQAIAKVIHEYQQRSIAAINGEGGWVKSYTGYIARTAHDSARIRRAGMDKWIDDVMAHLDVVRTFHDPDTARARKLLQDLWPQFVNGDHLDYSKPFDDTFSLIDIDFARKASAPRELHWTDADAWMAYNKAYGRFTPTYAIISAMDTAAKTTALMKEFGPTPRKGLEEDLHYLRGKYKNDIEAIGELDKRDARIRNLFAQFDGTSGRPVNSTIAQIGSDIRAVTRMSKLGLTPYAMLSDLAAKTSELRYQGMDPFTRFWGEGGFGDYFRGWGFVRGQQPDSMKRQVAELLQHAFDSEIGQIATRIDPSDSPAHDKLARAEQAFFRWTGMNSMTFNQRHAAERIMAAHLGMLRGAAYADLPEEAARVLSLYNVRQAEWDALGKVEWNDIGGKVFLTPDVALRLSDADVRAMMVTNGKLHQAAAGDAQMIMRERNDLSLRLAAYFADRGEFAVPEPGARERAIMYGGQSRDWAPGTLKGEALRLFLQFKMFPATMAYKVWSREIYGGQGKMGAAAGLAELFVYSTVLGVVANALNDVTKGQDPSARWRNAPVGAVVSAIARGGAGSIYGDFMLGEYSRFGRSFTSTLAGPTFGQLDSLFELYSDAAHMKAGKATAMLGLRSVRENLPFANMIYTKAAVDYLIYYRLQEWLNPGYLARHEQTMKQKQGTEYWLKPSQVSK